MRRRLHARRAEHREFFAALNSEVQMLYTGFNAGTESITGLEDDLRRLIYAHPRSSAMQIMLEYLAASLGFNVR